jgi:general secretion pathway protein D
MTRFVSGVRGLALCSLSLSVILAMSAGAQEQAQKEQTQKEGKPAAGKKEQEPKQQEEYIEVPTPFGIMRIPKTPGGAPAAPATQPGTTGASPAAQAGPATTTQTQGAGAAQKAPQTPPATTTAAPGSPAPSPQAKGREESGTPTNVRLQLDHVDLAQIINIIGSELKINYVVDPKVKGVATISTMGDVRHEDLLPLLDTILKLNGAAIVKTGNFYQIVPRTDVRQLPLTVRTENRPADPKSDEGMTMQVVPMRFVAAKDMAKLLESYVSEGGSIVVHEGGNILIIVETARNLARLLELVSVFDADAFRDQRVQLYPIKNNRARNLVEELQKVFSAYALSSKDSAIRFLSIDRINAILAVSPSPDSLVEVEKWIWRLDQPVEKAGRMNHVYKVENGEARNIARLLRQIYSPKTVSNLIAPPAPEPSSATKTPAVEAPLQEEARDLVQGEIKFVADEINNSLIIQASPQDYETILETIKSLDVVPRQVLIDAKIYEVALTGALSMGVQFFLEQRAARPPTSVSFTAAPDRGRRAGLDLQTFARIGSARDLLVFLNAQETRSKTRVLSSPSVIASDNIGARIQVGSEVPILTSQGVVPGGTGSQGLFSNTIQNRSTGVILNVTPRINSSGWVTLKIQQEVSSPVAPPEGSGIQSPSISIRSVETQVTVKDGESIALGGIIAENRLLSKNRVPLLGDIPYVGLLFGNTTYTNTRTELIAIITPHVIQDIESAADVTDELKSQLKNMKKELRRFDSANR